MNRLCWGKSGGVVSCERASQNGPIGTFLDGTDDWWEGLAMLAMLAAFLAVIFGGGNEGPALTLEGRWASTRYKAVAALGLVLLFSSLYHLLFGEGLLDGPQPSPRLDALNSRTYTVPTQNTVAAVLMTCLLHRSGWSCGCTALTVSATNAYAALSAVVAYVAAHDHLARRHVDTHAVYAAFDAAGVALGAATILVASQLDNAGGGV